MSVRSVHWLNQQAFLQNPNTNKSRAATATYEMNPLGNSERINPYYSNYSVAQAKASTENKYPHSFSMQQAAANGRNWARKYAGYGGKKKRTLRKRKLTKKTRKNYRK